MLAAVEVAVLDAAEAIVGERPGPIERMTWHDAMNRFGSDKPDTRFAMELIELTDVFAETGFKAFGSAESIKALRVPDGSAAYGRNKLDAMTDRAKSAAPRASSGCASATT